MFRQEPIAGAVYHVHSQAWGEEIFVLVDTTADPSIPLGQQRVNIRARFALFLAGCAPGERRVFIEDGGDTVEYEILDVILPAE
jgi:hypothetical protein